MNKKLYRHFKTNINNKTRNTKPKILVNNTFKTENNSYKDTQIKLIHAFYIFQPHNVYPKFQIQTSSETLKFFCHFFLFISYSQLHDSSNSAIWFPPIKNRSQPYIFFPAHILHSEITIWKKTKDLKMSIFFSHYSSWLKYVISNKMFLTWACESAVSVVSHLWSCRAEAGLKCFSRAELFDTVHS